MLARLLFFAILISPSLVHANNWTCITGANLTGDPIFYWAEGRDSWTGPGTIECTSGRRMLRVPTQVRYEGLSPGIGASNNSRLAIESSPIVTALPGSLAQNMVVMQDGDPDVWISPGTPLELSFYIFIDQLDRFAGSVRKGKLSIYVTATPQTIMLPGR
jgi:hypothetical protein